jgi:hypothetical protein
MDKIAAITTTLELYNKMIKLYPDCVNPGALWRSTQAVKEYDSYARSSTS